MIECYSKCCYLLLLLLKIKKVGVNVRIITFVSDHLIGGYTNGCIMMMFTVHC